MLDRNKVTNLLVKYIFFVWWRGGLSDGQIFFEGNRGGEKGLGQFSWA